MKILLINQDWFAEEWRAQGHEVVVASASPTSDIKFNNVVVHLSALLEQFTPDRIIVHDNSSPIMVVGLEDTEIPTVFYSVDAHHHSHYHKYVAGAFDLTYVAQRDYLPEYQQCGGGAEWLPLWASRVIEASSEKKYGAVFVGTMDPALNPDRVAFFTALKELVPLVIERGEYWKIFPFAEIVVNQTVKGDLNFRVFEAMMCGSMLLTERASNGLEDIFVPGKHIVTYEKGNYHEAAELIKKYLANPVECRAIAAAGRSEIMSKHQPIHRAATVMQRLESLTKRNGQLRFFGMLTNYAIIAALFDGIDQAVVSLALVRALRCVEQGLARQENMNYELSCHVVYSAVRYDQILGERKGAQLVGDLVTAYPNEPLFRFAAIREHLNYGERDQALALTAGFGVNDPEMIFSASEKLVGELLSRNRRR